MHYFFSPPASKPPHHTFDRGSYVYLFHNAAEHKAKLEIANHAGTPDQTAFSGFLDVARLSYSYNQPTLCTLTIDGGSVQGHDQWHLPNYDEKNEQKYLYKIHTLDLYLWTEKDATALLGHLKAVLPADRQDIKDAPSSLQTPAEHRDSMSPVVQQLEKTAIGAQFPPRTESTVSAHSLPGPPTPATSAGATQSPPAQPAPMAYNPAAPPAPEPIAHREKTPPPLDDGSGTGLASAARYEAVPQAQYGNVPNTFQSSGQPTPQPAYFSGPPQQQQQPRHPSIASFPGPPLGTPPQRTQSGSLPLPPPPPAGGPSPSQYTSSFAPPPGQQPTSPPPGQQNFHRQSTFSGPPQTQYANYNPQQQQQATPSFGPTALASPGMPGGQQQPPTPSSPPAYTPAGAPLPQQTQQQQIFGYSNYSYTAAQQQPPQGPAGAYNGDMHNQVYRPTEAEAGKHGSHSSASARPQQQQRQNSETRQKLEGRVRDVEGKVGGYLKKLDKLW